MGGDERAKGWSKRWGWGWGRTLYGVGVVREIGVVDEMTWLGRAKQV